MLFTLAGQAVVITKWYLQKLICEYRKTLFNGKLSSGQMTPSKSVCLLFLFLPHDNAKWLFIMSHYTVFGRHVFVLFLTRGALLLYHSCRKRIGFVTVQSIDHSPFFFQEAKTVFSLIWRVCMTFLLERGTSNVCFAPMKVILVPGCSVV